MLLQNSLPWRAWLGYLQVSSPSQWWSHHATVTIAGFVSVCRCAWLQRMCLTPFFYKETKGSGVSRNKNLNIFCIASLRWRSGTLTVKLWVKISWTVSVHIGKKSKGTNLKKTQRISSTFWEIPWFSFFPTVRWEDLSQTHARVFKELESGCG